MAITLREITRENFEECIRLQVRRDQPFVASNVYSLAEAKVSPEQIPLAIYAGEKMVGFVMYNLDHEKRELYISRLMIDKRYQHQGYGRATLETLRQVALQEPGIDRMALSTRPDNAYGIRVYEGFGFKDTGEQEYGEEVFVLELGKAHPGG